MSISKGFRYKDEKGKVTDYEYGVNGSNVTQDANHRLVTDEEKKKWNGKADPEDIPSGSAASYSVANNDTTTQAGFVADARIVKQHGDEIDQLSSDLGGLSFGTTEDGLPGWKDGDNIVIPFKSRDTAFVTCVTRDGSPYPANTEYVMDRDTTVKILTTNDYIRVYLNNVERQQIEIGTKDSTGHIGSWYTELDVKKGDVVKISTSTIGAVAYSIAY